MPVFIAEAVPVGPDQRKNLDKTRENTKIPAADSATHRGMDRSRAPLQFALRSAA
jgi:hypothetical protein